MRIKSLVPVIALALISCESHQILQDTFYSSQVTGTVTSTSSASVSGLTISVMIFPSGCTDSGGSLSGAVLTNASGQFSANALAFTDASRCVGIRVERDGTVVGSASGRLAEFRSETPYDTQVINVTIP